VPDSRIIVAIGRIERALARIEHAPPTIQADAELISRHAALRVAMEDAVSRIDQLAGRDRHG
jgi:hypothetical protein